MVRFIINMRIKNLSDDYKIYIPIWLDLLCDWSFKYNQCSSIYIPIWLDLLLENTRYLKKTHQDLHSNMVRFIILFFYLMLASISQIYIPIWLDLLLLYKVAYPRKLLNLHSNMVRFIIKKNEDTLSKFI